MQNIKIQLSNLFGCSGVRIYSNQRAKAVFRPCRNWLFLSRSVYLVFSFSRVFCLYCVFSPNPCNITGNSIHWPFLIQLHANTFTHTLHSLSLLPPLSLFPALSHKYKFRPPPPPLPQQISPAPASLTPNHSLPLTWNDCETTKTLGKHQIPHHSRGGPKRLQKILLAESYEDWEDGRVPDARKLQCAQIVG